MSELKWLEEYAGQTTAELLAMEGKYRPDSLVQAFEQALQQKSAKVGGFKRLTDEERVVLVVESIEREVNNGGFSQLFANSTSEYSPYFVSALESIGCSEAADLMQDAIDAMEPEEVESSDSDDDGMVEDDEERDQRLNECDERFADVAEEIPEALLKYIKRNKAKIVVKS